MGRVNPSIAIVIPAFNEEARLGETLRAVAAYGRTHDQPMAVTLVDDGSTDRTVELAAAAAAEESLDLDVLRVPHAGKGWAVRSGMLHAAATTRVDYLLMLDADNEISVDQLAGVPWTEDLATIYIGRRVEAVGGRFGSRPRLLRRLMSSGMRTLSRHLLGLRYPDTQCGFKLYPRTLVPDLFGQQQSKAWIFDAEILAIAARSGLPIVEVPVVWNPRGTSRVSATAALTSGLALLMVAGRLSAGRYLRVGVQVTEPR